MNPNKELWEKGDCTRIAATMLESGEALVQRIGGKAGMKLLDLGCGDGRNYCGSTMNAFAAAEKNGRAADLQKELETLFESKNESAYKTKTSIPATFLRVTVAV